MRTKSKTEQIALSNARLEESPLPCGKLLKPRDTATEIELYDPTSTTEATIRSVLALSPTAAVLRTDPLLREKYRKLALYHLRKLPALFTKFTGLFSRQIWAPAWPATWVRHTLGNWSLLCRDAAGGRAEKPAACRSCTARHLELALASGHKGHCFTCILGLHNYWLPLIVRGCLIGLAAIQALAMPVTAGPSAHPPARAHRTGQVRTTGGSRRSAKRMTRQEFCEAAKLLRLVYEHVETCALADLRKSDLTWAQQALVELQTVATRLRTELNGLVPAFHKNAPAFEPEGHTDRLVHAVLEYIHRHYSQPFTLQEYARRLRLNPAYLSAQFSCTVGTPFKTYLTEVRMEKARELLGDPSHNIAEVAYAVGYTSANRFRMAFKQVTGLSPRKWRETLRMQTPRRS